jgi:hypothetical protein
MILTITNTQDATADYLLARLSDSSLPFERINTDTLLEHSAVSYVPGRPSLRLGSKWYDPSDFHAVWYRRPEPLRSERVPDTPEGRCALDEWAEALESVFAHIPRDRWINYPAANALASRKLEQLTVALQCGFAIPDTIVTQEPNTLREFVAKHSGAVIVKPLGRAVVERLGELGDSVIFTNSLATHDIDDLSDLPACPTLFQQKVDKVSDVRITVIDGRIQAIELMAEDENGAQRCDIRRDNMADVRYRPIVLPKDVEDSVRQFTSTYQLRFAAIDMAVSKSGQWVFFENNPNGQWAWLDLFGGATIYKMFLESFASVVAG